MKGFRKYFTWFEDIFSSVFLIIGFGLMLYEIIMRYVFDSPTTWINEVSTALVVWSVFLGLSLALRDNRHIGVDLFYAALPRSIRKWIDYFANVLGVVFCIVFTCNALVLIKNMVVSARLSVETEVPLWIYNLVLPIAGVMFMLRFIERIWKIHRSDHYNNTGGGKEL
jgi:C4-dicarboxylate transporter DctQ subunit